MLQGFDPRAEASSTAASVPRVPASYTPSTHAGRPNGLVAGLPISVHKKIPLKSYFKARNSAPLPDVDAVARSIDRI